MNRDPRKRVLFGGSSTMCCTDVCLFGCGDRGVCLFRCGDRGVKVALSAIMWDICTYKRLYFFFSLISQ